MARVIWFGVEMTGDPTNMLFKCNKIYLISAESHNREMVSQKHSILKCTFFSTYNFCKKAVIEHKLSVVSHVGKAVIFI